MLYNPNRHEANPQENDQYNWALSHWNDAIQSLFRGIYSCLEEMLVKYEKAHAQWWSRESDKKHPLFEETEPNLDLVLHYKLDWK